MTVDEFDAVVAEVATDGGDFSADNFLAGCENVAEEGGASLVEVGSVGTDAAEGEDCFAKCFAGDGAGVDHCAADGGRTFDDANRLAEFGGSDRGTLSTSAGADHDEVEGVHVGDNTGIRH